MFWNMERQFFRKGQSWRLQNPLETAGKVTTTGGQEIDSKIYKNSDLIASFTHWYIPFQLDSYCVSIRSRPVKLPDGDEMTFIFIHTEGKDLWLVLLDNA